MDNITLDKKEVFKVLENPESYATVLHTICLITFGEELYQKDSLEIYMELKDTYGVQMHEDNESKLMAIMTAVSTPFFFSDKTVFDSICKSLLNGDPGLTDLELEHSTMLEVLWGIYEVGLNIDFNEFTPSVQSFIDTIFNQEALELGTTSEDVLQAYNKVIEEMAMELSIQLKKIGIADAPVLPSMV
jgi:hypothetical protein